jgi:hypothetical protein
MRRDPRLGSRCEMDGLGIEVVKESVKGMVVRTG